jgi:hypothetical protein
MLIISSDTESVYKEHRKIWSSYMNSNPSIHAYFIQYGDVKQTLENNTLWLTGKESFKAITTKTIDGFDFFLRKNDYDFIVRTNMSSFWNFEALMKFLNQLPKEKLYSGFIGNHNGIKFASGSGFIMSSDVAKLLINNRNIAERVGIVDDVDIGYTMYKLGIPIYPGRRIDFHSKEMFLKHNYDPNAYHYRLKWHDRAKRCEEPEFMKLLILKQTKSL